MDTNILISDYLSGSYKITKDKIMSNKSEINNLRSKMEESILKGDDYSIIYKLSTDLDKLIMNYYREQNSFINEKTK